MTDPAPFLEELEAVRSRGYTLGFHQGRPGPFSENRNYGQSASAFEYAGLVRGWRKGELLVEVKNRIESGDVLEFVLPGTMRNVRLRVYDFLLEGADAKVARVSAGEGRAICIPQQAFHAEPIAEGDLPQGSVVRKATFLDDEARAVVAHNHKTYLAEQGLIPSASLSVPRTSARVGKPPRLGPDGCCGLGCNGCLPFWHEPRYERARATLSARSDGERLAAPFERPGLSSLD